MRKDRGWSAVVAVSWATWLTCAPLAGVADETAGAELVHVGETVDGVTRWLPPEPIPPEAYSFDPDAKPPVEDVPERRPEEKIHPLLARWLEERPGSDLVRLLVALEETVPIPRFPELRLDEDRGSPANLAALDRAQDLARTVRARRAPIYARHGEELGRRFGGRVLGTFWLASAMHVELPLAAVPALSEHPAVRYLEPEASGAAPPQSTTSPPGAPRSIPTSTSTWASRRATSPSSTPASGRRTSSTAAPRTSASCATASQAPVRAARAAASSPRTSATTGRRAPRS